MPPKPVYTDLETQESAKRLAGLVQDLPHPVALAGGHAVRWTAGPRWQERFGEDYFGSRDIDLAYLVRPEWSEAEFRASAAGQAPRRIQELGYKSHGSYRFCLMLNSKGEPIDEEPPGFPIVGVDYAQLFLDPLMTAQHTLAPQVLGWTPLVEPLLERALVDPAWRTPLPQLGANVFLPSPGLLLATKLSHLDERDGDKAIKDLCDIFALTAYSGEPLNDLATQVHHVLEETMKRVQMVIRHEDLPEACVHLDVASRDYEAVVGPLAIKPRAR